jgi:hypothetical protein
MESRDDVKKIRIGAMEQLGAIPKVLKELQELVPLLSVAYSTDGRTFGYEAPLSMSILVGSYVALAAQGGAEYLGQVVTKEVSVRQGAEIGLELDPSLSALLPEGISFSWVSWVTIDTYRRPTKMAFRAPTSHPWAKAW